MATAVFYDKAGGAETLAVEAGDTARGVLRREGIPLNAVLTCINGSIVSEDVAVIRPDDHVEFRQVRHYDTAVTRGGERTRYATPNPVYTKSVVHSRNGGHQIVSEQFDREAFIGYVEEVFLQSCAEHDVLPRSGPVVMGLSGGRDSVALLTLLERTRDRIALPPMTAVTVTGLPDWEEPATFSAAVASCAGLGIDHVVVPAEEISQLFRLRVPLATALNTVVAGEDASHTMLITHHVMRRMVEITAERLGGRTIALGLNSDDLVATMLTWFTTGFQMGAIPVRRIGSLFYTFPLYRITKKELTLYLELIAPERNRQGAPGRFTTGPGERSLVYSVTDHLYDLWPGVDYYLFHAFEKMRRYTIDEEHRACRVCGGSYLVLPGRSNPADLCDVCWFFIRHELSHGG
jgi:tRNA(Ile)-lysidine synthase TilS/MesJ